MAGRPFRTAYVSHLIGMVLFGVAMMSGGSVGIWGFTILLTVGATGTLAFGGRRSSVLGKLALVSGILVLLAVVGDLSLEAIDPDFGYGLYVSLFLVPGIVTWLSLVAVASSHRTPADDAQTNRLSASSETAS
jgi:hypothetical protein